MSHFRATTNLSLNQEKNLLLIFIIFLSVFIFSTNNIKAQTTEQNNNLEEQLQIINSTLSSYPAQNNSKYMEINRVSINSKGKLMLYKQYQVAVSCTASREEVFLTDLEPSNITSFTKGNTMVLTVGCKDGLGNCVQRFFRNSCDVTFKPESFQKELLIISSANLRNTEQLRVAFSQLIKIANNTYQKPNNLEDKEGTKNNINKGLGVESVSTSLNKPSLISINPTIEEKKSPKLSLTMDDIELAQKKSRKSEKINQDKTPSLEKPTQTSEDLNLEELLDLLLKNE